MSARVRHMTSYSTVIFLCITLLLYHHEICFNLWRTKWQDHKYTWLRDLRFKFTALLWRLLSGRIRCCKVCLYKSCWLFAPKTIFVVINWMKKTSKNDLYYHSHRKPQCSPAPKRAWFYFCSTDTSYMFLTL